MSQDVHVLPNGDTWEGRPHAESRACWCEPLIEFVCTECAEAGESRAHCWRCNGTGLVKNGNTEVGAVVTHNATDGRK